MGTTANASLPIVDSPAGASVAAPVLSRPPPVATVSPAWRLAEDTEAVDTLEAPAIIFGTILAGILISVLVLGVLWGSLAIG